MIRADQAADALAELMRGRDQTQLAEVLAEALDRYALTRLYLMARARLGPHRGPDFQIYCPWCSAEFTESTFSEHVSSRHNTVSQ